MKNSLGAIFWFLIFSSTIFANIRKTNEVAPIKAEIIQSSKDTLIIFDVASVLMSAKDALLDPKNKNYFKQLAQGRFHKSSASTDPYLASIILSMRTEELVDPLMPSIIKEAQDRGIKALGLTSGHTGPFGIIPKLEDLRIKKLASLGYHFNISWSDLLPKVFDHIVPRIRNRIPAYKEGIVFTCRLNKGILLKAFLDYARYKPKKIIFVDNKITNLEAVQQYAQENNIQFVGFEYTSVEERITKPLNQEIAKFQIETLMKDKKWVSDEELLMRLRKAVSA